MQGRKAREVSLTGFLRQALHWLKNRPGTSQKIVVRAGIILAAAEGLGSLGIVEELGVHKNTVCTWRARWQAAQETLARIVVRVEAKKKGNRVKDLAKAISSEVLCDAFRKGTPPTFTPEQICGIIALACQKPENFKIPITHWTHSELAVAAVEQGIVENISPRQIGRFLCELELRPDKFKMWLNPKIDDPETFAQNAMEICTTYREAPELAENGTDVVSIDEMSGIQAIERIHPSKPVRPGKTELIESEYKRHGTQTLICGFNIASGKVVCSRIGDTRTEEDTAKFIEELIGHHAGRKLIIIADNLNTHKSEAVVRVVAKHCDPEAELGKKGELGVLKNMESRARFLVDPTHDIRFVYTPKHCSWLNQIEIWFGILSRKVIRRGSFRSKNELKERILAFIEYFNAAMAKAFKWTYTGRPLTA